MGHWARIDDNNIVQEVIVIKESELDTGAWGDKSKWIKTSFNTNFGKHYTPKDNQDFQDLSDTQNKSLRFRFAGIGMFYDAENDVFYEQKPADNPSFVLNKTTWAWEPPKAEPKRTAQQEAVRCYFDWNEKKQDWELVTPPPLEKPYASWIETKKEFTTKDGETFTVTDVNPPIDYPSDGKDYKWDEDLYQSDNKKGWVKFKE